MEWISVKDKQPKIYEVVWIYWKNRQVLLGCRTYEHEEQWDPCGGWYSFEDDKGGPVWWWMPVSASLDKPEKPK